MVAHRPSLGSHNNKGTKHEMLGEQQGESMIAYLSLLMMVLSGSDVESSFHTNVCTGVENENKKRLPVLELEGRSVQAIRADRQIALETRSVKSDAS